MAGRDDIQSYDADSGEPFGSVYLMRPKPGEIRADSDEPDLIARTFGDRCQANAKLFAASPDLLAVVESAMPILEYAAGSIVSPNRTITSDIRDAAKAAIAKATS